MEVFRAALTGRDALSSYLSSPWSIEFKANEPSCAELIGDGAAEMVATLLQNTEIIGDAGGLDAIESGLCKCPIVGRLVGTR